MIHLRKPSESKVIDLLESQQAETLTYQSEGQTDGFLPDGYSLNTISAVVGHGPETFRCAAEALQGFEVMRLDWVDAVSDGPFEPGTNLCLISRQWGLWVTNVVRVVHCTSGDEDQTRSACSVGTLPAHLMRGEEWMVVEHRSDDSVWLHVTSFARPRHWLAWLTFPLIRRTQRRFARDAVRNLIELVGVRTSS